MMTESDRLFEQMKKIFLRYNIDKVVLFGSRARGDNEQNSDFDFAVYKREMPEIDRAKFCLEVEDIDTFFRIDIVFFNDELDEQLKENIKREGRVIYERT